MIEILSLMSPLFGGLFRLLPSILDFLHKGQDNAHELAMVDKQIALAKVQSEQKISEIKAQGEDERATLAAQTDSNTEGAWSQALLDAIKAQGSMTGVKWVDALNQSVRPVITYWWCLLLYSVAKAVTLVVALQASTPLAQLAPLVVTDFDRSVIGSILGFWFVDRALRKLGR